MIKKADIILFASLIIASICALCLLTLKVSDASMVKITYNGSLYGEYSLNTDQEISIADSNVIKIEGGEVYMESANCKGQDCVHQGKIKDSGQSIVCLPNKLIVEIEGSTNKYDEVAS